MVRNSVRSPHEAETHSRHRTGSAIAKLRAVSVLLRLFGEEESGQGLKPISSPDSSQEPEGPCSLRRRISVNSAARLANSSRRQPRPPTPTDSIRPAAAAWLGREAWCWPGVAVCRSWAANLAARSAATRMCWTALADRAARLRVACLGWAGEGTCPYATFLPVRKLGRARAAVATWSLASSAGRACGRRRFRPDARCGCCAGRRARTGDLLLLLLRSTSWLR